MPNTNEDFKKEIEQMQKNMINEQSKVPVYQTQIVDFEKALENAKFNLKQSEDNIQRYIGGISVLQNRINLSEKDKKIVDAINAASKPEEPKEKKLSKKQKLAEKFKNKKVKEDEILDKEVNKLLEEPKT